ncbi:MAG: response regulator [Candidatus Methanoperedens sp.]|nr:response regulator [Candidatus Methanoperedens sp.]
MGVTLNAGLPDTAATEMQKSSEQSPCIPAGHGELILVVDDDDAIREITSSILDTHGYRVITASNGAEAIALYEQNRDKIKVVLMDMIMPVMDGARSVQVLRKGYPAIRIIVVSGLIKEDKLAQVIDHVQAFLPKPYTVEKLLTVVHKVIGANSTVETEV